MLDFFLQTTAKLATRSCNFLQLRDRCMFSFGFFTPITELSHLTRQICLLFSFSKTLHSSCHHLLYSCFVILSLALEGDHDWSCSTLLIGHNHTCSTVSSFSLPFSLQWSFYLFYNTGGGDEKCSISSSFQCISFFFNFLRAWGTYSLMNVKIKRCNYVLRNWSHGILKNWVNSGTHWNSNIWWKVQRF